jgi:hypothetical protein
MLGNRVSMRFAFVGYGTEKQTDFGLIQPDSEHQSWQRCLQHITSTTTASLDL